jgi:TIR domain
MAPPLTVLLADDQIPWDTAAENERTKAEIRREFSVEKPGIDVDTAFADDFAWFTGLLSYLEDTRGERVIRARTFEEARQRINNPRDLDVAIVDLSWWGDYTLPQGAKHRNNRGLELLELAGDPDRSKVPIIALSQNFTKDFELITTVLERGAFPVPKNYRDRNLAYRALYAAVRYLTRERGRRSSKVEVFISHAHEDGELARRLVRAIQAGLQIPSEAIRCTSCPGYDLAPGTDFIEALKNELTGAACVVGLWTAQSVKSQWCLFELGAAWGLAQKTFFLSQGAEALRDPPAGFRSIQASQLADAGQLRRFLEQLAIIIRRPIANRAAAERELDDLAKSVEVRPRAAKLGGRTSRKRGARR